MLFDANLLFIYLIEDRGQRGDRVSRIVDRASARIYAQLRQDRTLKPPDAIQLSCAASAKCDLFITNDDRLSLKIVPGIQFIASLDQSRIL